MNKHSPLPQFSQRVSEARRQKGLTQSVLADRIACKQSAISMLERGNLQALAPDKQEALAQHLALPWPPDDTPPPPHPHTEPMQARGFCPHFDCPANVPYSTAGRLLAIPRQPAAHAHGPYCRYCGEVCESRCSTCSAPYQSGACCPNCGTPYILVPESLRTHTDIEHWLAEQHRLIAQLS